MNDMNSIAGVDDFASEMKKNLEELHELQDKYNKALAFIAFVAQPEARKYTQEYGCVAEKLLKEIGDAPEVSDD